MKIIVLGISNYSQMLKDYIKDLGIEVIAFMVDGEYIKANEIDGIPVVPIEKLDNYYPNNEIQLALGIGYTQLGNLRKEMYSKCKNKGYHFFNYIHPSAVIDKTVEMGEGNVLFENVVIQKHTKIGIGNLFFSNSVIMHDNRIGNHITFGACSVSNGFVQIRDCCFIGANSTIKDNVIIRENTLVGAGTYVNKSTEKNMGILTAKPFYQSGGGITLSKKL